MSTPAEPHPAEVSDREAEVLAAVGDGLSNAQIAHRLHITVRTVEGHVSSLLRKCGVADRRALAALAGTASPTTPPGRLAGLPRFRTTFVGRGQERDELLAALAGGQLVTLTGHGGVGKTRLAAVAAETAAPAYPFGGAFVDLVPARNGLLVQSVAAVLGVTERPHQSLESAVVERLGRGPSLLILDNCEHLIDAAAGLVERIMSACPATAVVATSRERLGVPGERVFPVGPLPLHSEAERLFYDRAVAADPGSVPDPRLVSDICTRLDGLPLAIELAAARSAALGAAGLLTGLGDYLRLLAGGRGAVVRHRSLRSVIGWSHDLLDEEERTLLRRLAVFVGGFDLSAAVAVAAPRPGGPAPTPPGDLAAAADVLGRLVDKSLVVHRQGATSHWRLLETIRAFAGEQLDEAGERAEVQQHYLQWAAATAAALERRLEKPHGPPSDWRNEFDTVADDLRTALAAAGSIPDPVSHQLAHSLAHLTFARRFLTEAIDHYQRAARCAPTPGAAARDLCSAAECAQVVNDSGQAHQWQLAAAEQARAAGDDDARAVALARSVEIASRFPVTFRAEVPYSRLRQLLADATAAGDPDRPAVAARLACAAAWTASPEKLTPDPALARTAVAAARATGDPVLLSAGLDAMRTAAMAAGRVRDAHRITSQRLALLDRMDPNNPYAASEIEDTLGLACSDAVAAGDLTAARSAASRIEDDDLLGDHPYLTASKVIPALVLSGYLDRAVRLADRMWDGWQRAGRPPAFWMQATVHFVALAHGLRADPHRLVIWRAREVELASGSGPLRPRLSPLAAFVDARIAIQSGELDDAAAVVERACAESRRGRYLAYARATGAELAVVAGRPDAADRLASAMPWAAEHEWAAACLARATGRLHGRADALAASIERWERLGARFERACTLLLIPERADEGRTELTALRSSS